MEKCTHKHFNNVDNDFFDNLKLTYCLPKNYSTQLMYNGTYESFGEIVFDYCKTKKDS